MPTKQVDESPLEEALGEVLGAQVALDAIPVQVVVELGRMRLTIKQLRELVPGSIVELDGLAGDPINVLVNDCLIAQGEVMVVNDKFAIHITDIVTPTERLRKVG